MAIDDNKTYGLTGAQIQELPGKIEAVKGLTKVLTSADYNYHSTGTVDNQIALWRLKPGVYTVDDSVNASDVLYMSGSSFGNGYKTFIIGEYDSTQLIVFALGYLTNATPNPIIATTLMQKTGGGAHPMRKALTDDAIVNNLTSDWSRYVLSAKQGKVLNDKIEGRIIQNAGAPTTATVGTVGQLLEDTTNGDLYICTAIVPGADTNPDTYTWEEVGAGGSGGSGGVIELTTADYNYPTNNPDGIAMWLLDDGIYRNSTGSNLKFYRGTSSNRQLPTDFSFLKLSYYDSPIVYFGLDEFLKPIYYTCRADGSIASDYKIITNRQLTDNLDYSGSAGYNALDARQGKVLNDKITPDSGSGAPTTSTVGILGKIYIDTDTDNAYMCTKVDNGTYTWKQITA